ncbi:hypothetical protein RhiXN_10377 [Rhizoctonia solani]|uniref:Laminin domain protein n=1 Tax=Rhizoctonia solani TaxID=456999 RepID=A0A8H8P583_9AGAM|nr:uncharacterized protein RhiXN_10377 [Rhizoctonia solani]QRW24053.1 hypothetical protein RhiXN_10377 [Rhizoctonia solani]
MSIVTVNQVYSPPELPQYLKDVYDLKAIVGIPTDDELVGIHSVIQMASKATENAIALSSWTRRPATTRSSLRALILRANGPSTRVSVIVARYRRAYLDVVLPEHTTYTPPTLPAHINVHLEPITGIPSGEEVVKVQEAIRLYQQFSNVPSMFNPYVNVELSQHLFDIQMARYTQHARQKNTMQCESPSSNTAKPATNLDEVSSLTTNNAGTGADSTQSLESVQKIQGSIIQYAIEKSNQLSEEANKLMERANILIERSNELMERSSSRPAEQPCPDSAKFSEIFERMNGHLEHSNNLAGGLAKPIETMGDTLQTINRVLVRIQHAIVRSHKDNTTSAFDCLVNERGEVPALSPVTDRSSFTHASKDLPISVKSIDPIISGVNREFRIENQWLGKYLRFYGIAEEVFEDDIGTRLKEGQDHIARAS